MSGLDITRDMMKHYKASLRRYERAWEKQETARKHLMELEEEAEAAKQDMLEAQDALNNGCTMDDWQEDMERQRAAEMRRQERQ